ncbi:hypothetical protein SLA2020_021110 [Shorea laevis]
MEDIEDLLIGSGGAPPVFRLPLNDVGVNPRRNTNKPNPANAKLSQIHDISSPKIPGTQTIYIKTFGCSHNQSDSEYMAGQLSAFGYALTDNPEEGDLWLINTCTVKSPSQSAMNTLITKCKEAKKPLQIDRVVEVVEETLKGHEVRLLTRKTLPALDLPKVRKNKFIEILPINIGCLGACTYCKTKHARGHLGSYTVDSLVGRVKTVIADGVREIWLSSEDTGAYCRDIGVNLPTLLNAIVSELPPDGSTMLRIGMTNPPYILEHLKEIADVLRHPCVYSFLHVPVQSGSDAILTAMNREYTVSEFSTVVDTLNELAPGMQIATDIICGFPGETDEDFAQTVNLIKEYKFPQVHISQFYPRPGTPAARMKKVPSTIVKKRSRELTSVFEAFMPYNGMEGRVERIWITEIATDGIHLVGHTKGYVQVLVIGPESLLGTSAIVKITSVGRWSVFGEVIETLNTVPTKRTSNQENSSACCKSYKSYACSNEPEPCSCRPDSCGAQLISEECTVSKSNSWIEDRNSKNLIGWFLRRRRNHVQKMKEDGITPRLKKKQIWVLGNMSEWGIIDGALLGRMFVSFSIIIAVVIRLGLRIMSSNES